MPMKAEGASNLWGLFVNAFLKLLVLQILLLYNACTHSSLAVPHPTFAAIFCASIHVFLPPIS